MARNPAFQKLLQPEAFEWSHELQALTEALQLEANLPVSRHWMAPILIAVGVTAATVPLSYAAPGDINSTNTDAAVAGGNYYNTQGSQTTFTNNSSLTVGAGVTVRGLEVTPNSTVGSITTTGNGGRMVFNAPIVRFDGTVDVSAIRNGVVFQGNGGQVIVNAQNYYQNGTIYAAGANGGTVLLNVGAATMGPNAKIDATAGPNANNIIGNGGVVNIKSTGLVNIARGAVVDTSGKVIGDYDTNVISIEGGIVNNAGVLRANGITDENCQGTNGGKITLVSNLPCDATTVRKAVDATFDSNPNAVESRLNDLLAAGEGVVINKGIIEANGGNGTYGGHGGHGGQIDIRATYVVNTQTNGTSAVIAANGGNGGYNDCGDGGNGGNGGLINVQFHKMRNDGLVASNGGHGGDGINGGHGGNGGTITLQGFSNPIGTGLIAADGGNGGNGLTKIAYGYDEYGNGPYPYYVGGNGGNGGNGGVLKVFDPNTLNVNVNLSGGNGGCAGNPCAAPGKPGDCGTIVKVDPPPCDVPPPPGNRPPVPFIPPLVFSLIDYQQPNAGIAPAALVSELPPDQVFLAQEQVPPETALRRRLEREIAESQKNPFKQPTPIKRHTKVRGYW